MKTRTGTAYVELMVTLALSGMIAVALTSVLLTQLRLARVLTARAALADAARLVLHVIPGELRFASPARDLRGCGTDSVAGRLPRLSGTVCGVTGGRMWAQLEGMREPDPTKDSLLVISARGEVAYQLHAAVPEAGPCPPGRAGRAYRLDTGGAPPPSGAVIVFESGSYYLRDRALRYRLGGEGRQPLTEEAFQASGSRLLLSSDSPLVRLRVTLAARPAAGVSGSARYASGLVFLNPVVRP